MRKRTGSQAHVHPDGAGVLGVLPRITRACARAASRRPKATLALWLLLVVGLLGVGIATGTRTAAGGDYGAGESEEARELLAAADLARDDPENVLITSADADVTTAATAELARAAEKLPSVEWVRGPAQHHGLAADEGRIALVQVALAEEDGEPRVDELLATIDAARAASPDAEFQVAGPAALDEAVGEVVSQDLRKAELISLPITLLILLGVFGALVAAAVPLALGITSVLAAIGGMGPISQIAPMDESAISLVVLMGLAVGVDYSLFYIRREREERAAGRGPDAALNATAATVGRAIVISGVTVALALSGLFLTGLDFFIGMGLATILVVAVAVVGSLTALPALLSILGERVDKGAMPWLRRNGGRAADERSRGFWGRLASLVTARPRVALVVALSLLGALAVPALDMRTGGSNGGLAEGEAIVQAQAAIDASFPGASTAAQVVVEGDGLTQEELGPLAERAGKIGAGEGGVEVAVADGGNLGVVTVPVAGEPGRALERLRGGLDDVAPPDARMLVGGTLAENADFTDQISDSIPVVVGAVLVLALALLLASFRSLPLAAAVVALNLVSVAATYGATTLIFQGTWAEDLLGFTSISAIVDWIPIFTFVILFALSMDYTILVLERMREARAAGLSPRAAAAAGVSRTAGAVTSAAAVMVAIFAIFPTLPMLEMKQFGVALAIGVLLDATLVRGIALPAAVTLLGAAGLRRPRRARPGPARRRVGWDDREVIAELEGNATRG